MAAYPRPSSSVVVEYMGSSSLVTAISRGIFRAWRHVVKKKKREAHRRHPRSVRGCELAEHILHTPHARTSVHQAGATRRGWPWGHALSHQSFHRSTDSTSQRNNVAAGPINFDLIWVPSKSHFVTIWIPGVQGRDRLSDATVKEEAVLHLAFQSYGRGCYPDTPLS